MYDGVAILKGKKVTSRDKYGNPIVTVKETTVFVQPRGVYQSEFYNAAQLGLQPSLSLYLTHRADYDGQKILEYDGKLYDVIRVDWSAQRDGITLVCNERAGLLSKEGEESEASGS